MPAAVTVITSADNHEFQDQRTSTSKAHDDLEQTAENIERLTKQAH